MFEMIIDLLPLAVLLFDVKGNILLKGGGLAHLFDDTIPAREHEAAVRWEILDPNGERIARDQWPDECALQGRTEAREIALCFPPDGDALTTRWVAFPISVNAKEGGGVLLVEALAPAVPDDADARQVLETNLMDAFTSAIRRACRDGSMLAVGLAAGRSLRAHDNGSDQPEDLTSREAEVLKMIAWGLGNKEIAAELGIGVKTVEFHRARGIKRLGLKGERDVVRYALARGWLADC